MRQPCPDCRTTLTIGGRQCRRCRDRSALPASSRNRAGQLILNLCRERDLSLHLASAQSGVSRQSLGRLIHDETETMKQPTARKLADWHGSLDAHGWIELVGGRSAEELAGATLRDRYQGKQPPHLAPSKPGELSPGFRAHLQQIATELRGPTVSIEDPEILALALSERNRRASRGNRGVPDPAAADRIKRLKVQLGRKGWATHMKELREKGELKRIVGWYKVAARKLDSMTRLTKHDRKVQCLVQTGLPDLLAVITRDELDQRKLVASLKEEGDVKLVSGWVRRSGRRRPGVERPQTQDERLGPWIGKAFGRRWKSKDQLPLARTLVSGGARQSGRPLQQRLPERYRSWPGMVKIAALVVYLHDSQHLSLLEITARFAAFGWRHRGSAAPMASAFYQLGLDLARLSTWASLWRPAVESAPLEWGRLQKLTLA